MRDLYSDDYESVAGGGSARLIPDGFRKLSGAAVFLGLVAALGLWSYRLGTRDAAEVPIIRAMEGPARIEPENPGGLQTAHQGLEVNTVLAGRPAPMPRDAAPAAAQPEVLVAEDAPQGELILAAPAILAAKVLGEGSLGDGEDLPMPPQEDTAATTPEMAVAEVVLAETTEEAAAAAAVAGPRPRNRPANLARPKKASAPVVQTAAVKAPETKAPATRTPETKATQVASAAPAGREVSGVQSGARLVQLGAFDSEAITRSAWSQLVARNPDLLSSKSLFVERTTSNARVFYRLRVAGFSSSEETRQMCEALRARGVACIPVTLQ